MQTVQFYRQQFNFKLPSIISIQYYMDYAGYC